MIAASNCSVINHSIFAFGKHDAIGFANVENHQVNFHHVIDKQVMNRGICGISCIAGNINESIYAIGDISIPPRIILLTLANEYICQLQSTIDSDDNRI